MSRHFLLDGYNVLHKMPELSGLKLEDGREGLVRFIRDNRPQGRPPNIVTLVFDGQEGVGAGSPDFFTDVRVLFSRGESADDLIKHLLEEAGRPGDIILVSDDREVRYYARSCGAEVWSVERFVAQGRRAAPMALKTERPGHPAKPDGKVISKVFESKVNQELKKIWLKEDRE